MRITTVFIAALFLLVGTGGQTMGAPPTRTIEKGGYRLELDLGPQVLHIDIPEDTDWGESRAKTSAPIRSRLDRVGGDIVSASILAQKAKIFDDGLYAAVDLAAQEGLGSFGGKGALLRTLTFVLADGSAGQPGEVVLAAARLGGAEVDLPNPVDEAVQRRTQAFLADELRSKPISFYTWSDALSSIFRQDRMLQEELKGAEGIEAVARAIQGDAQARKTYEDYLRLVSRLTNPLAATSLHELLSALDGGALLAPDRGIHFFPPSRAHETELIKKLYGDRPIPDGFSLVDELVTRIRDGRLDLAPTAESGWYDYQTWALEPLVIPERMPEGGRLELGEEYRKQLLELFKGLLTLTRETHIKQLEMPSVGGAVVPMPSFDVYPELSAEPTVTFYLRRAKTYGFIRRVLAETFGAEALKETRRLTEDGPSPVTLDAELSSMEVLFRGAYLAVSRELGTEIALTDPDREALAAFASWSTTRAEDPDLSRDVRAMVPVFYDVLRQKTKVWLFLGWAGRPVRVGFAKEPAWKAFDPDGKPVTGGKAPKVRFKDRRFTLAYPVTAEVYVERILNRAEFRKVCDRHRTREKILEALQ